MRRAVLVIEVFIGLTSPNELLVPAPRSILARELLLPLKGQMLPDDRATNQRQLTGGIHTQGQVLTVEGVRSGKSEMH